MSYKIAVATSDGINVDSSFGATSKFTIYEVNGSQYAFSEERQYVLSQETLLATRQMRECGSGLGCEMGRGCSSGCGSPSSLLAKVQLISDCRCVVCKKIGFNILKQLEKCAIISFDVECKVEVALKKIIQYLEKVDGHQ